MSLQIRLNELITAIGADVNQLYDNDGNLAALTTTHTLTLVGAINELVTSIGSTTLLSSADKTSLVAALNELWGRVGELTSLTTVDQTSTVAAINEVVTQRGPLTSLTTTDTSSLVAAINELDAAIAAVSAGAGSIDDGVTTTSTTWSSQKTNDEIVLAINNLVAGAPAALDTLIELATELQTQDTAVGGLLTAITNRLRFDEAQSLDAIQMAQGNANLGSLSLVQAGDPETDLSALYSSAKA